jgi:hypothetical protein
MNKKLILLLCFILSPIANSVIINTEMGKVSKELNTLIPFLVSETDFSDAKNEKSINTSLETIEKVFTNLKSHPRVNKPGFAINRELMVQQIKETRKLFNGPKRDFARHKLNSSLSLCISCHSQVSKKDQLKMFHDVKVENLKIDNFAKGEFLFITREFDEGIKYYDKYIREFSGSREDWKKVNEALNRKLTYYTRIKPSPLEGALSFKQDKENIKLPKEIKESLSTWITKLESTNPCRDFDPKKASQTELEDYMKKYVEPVEGGSPITSMIDHSEVDDLEISGKLYEYLNLHPETKSAPEIYYWLAKIDKKLNFNIFYSLGDLYLIECMEKYAKNPSAKKCYQAYEEDIIFSYTGSAGTNVPKEIKADLEKYKKLLKIK